jgi:hypothetical protein
MATDVARVRPPDLSWRRPDAYHIISVDERYTVCRLNHSGRILYLAFRRGSPAIQIGEASLPADARDDQLMTAIRAMQLKCAEHAATGAP